MSRLRTANLLAAFARDVTTRAEEQLKTHHSQTDSALAALNTMSYWEGITNSQLARALGLSHTATVRLVDKLESQGLVEASSGTDLRATHLNLTAAGKAAAQPALTARCAAVGSYLDGLDAAEQDQLAHLLEKLIRPLATDDEAVSHFCRLCDFTSCPDDQCPMHAGDHA
ncbi:MarR family winged helix-turn-helix transcriptional regulator [Devosia sp.]|uniref:MarR family winged helix-turn-helix transcriptional regulator n=1 Tax=Devosia sp. TaxID=1871048 RepID=UPI003BABDFF7